MLDIGKDQGMQRWEEVDREQTRAEGYQPDLPAKEREIL
jgi:hypothetical protein